MDRQLSITPRDLECMLCDETAEPKALPLSLLEEITSGFSEEQEIGRGGFAVVYKGNLENRNVAVKKMSDAFMDEKVFHREVECLMMVKHKNVVQFLGYCADRQGSMERCGGQFVMADVNQRLLCFEHLPKGGLDNYITDKSPKLPWRDCYQIITGICQGLHYLHQKNILHLDLKPANILLGENWVPKIADFGISRCFDQMQSQVLSNIAGTLGYCAPESFNHTKDTYRNSYQLDIYSLGVVIIEILTRKKGHEDVEKVVESWTNMLDESESEIQLEQVRLCTEIGIECTNFDPAKRPNTQDIINRLNDIESVYGCTKTGVIASQHINPDMLDETMHDFWLRYQLLGPDVRRCIEYCSIFPKGSRLRMVDLVHLWVAQGFVKNSCAREDLEDVAEGYVQELVSCSFLQQEGTGVLIVHDVLHELLDKVAKNCFRIENACSHDGEGWEEDVPRDVQHLFVQNYDEELITEKILGLRKLRTLIIFVVGDDTPVKKYVIERICKWLPELRVLAVAFSKEHSPIKQPNRLSIPESISKLKNLCYLAFRANQDCKVILPITVNKLRHIQLLNFGYGNLLVLDLGNLINLRHIFCGSTLECPDNIDKLTSLRTIPNFIVSSVQGYELKLLRDLNNLRGRLLIEGLEDVKSKEDALEANLTAKEQLTQLSLLWDFDVRRCSPEIQAEVLDGLCPPTGLKELVIWDYRGSRYPDWMVGKQNGGPKILQKLSLWRCIQLGSVSALAEAFPHLRVLGLYNCMWDFLPGNMELLTSLSEIDIHNCNDIISLPTLPQSLERFSLHCCNYEFMETCETVGHPNWEKIQHIRKKEFSYFPLMVGSTP